MHVEHGDQPPALDQGHVDHGAQAGGPIFFACRLPCGRQQVQIGIVDAQHAPAAQLANQRRRNRRCDECLAGSASCRRVQSHTTVAVSPDRSISA